MKGRQWERSFLDVNMNYLYWGKQLFFQKIHLLFLLQRNSLEGAR